jgi:hypothetical protein
VYVEELRDLLADTVLTVMLKGQVLAAVAALDHDHELLGRRFRHLHVLRSLRSPSSNTSSSDGIVRLANVIRREY